MGPIIKLKKIIKLFHFSSSFTFQILTIIIELKKYYESYCTIHNRGDGGDGPRRGGCSVLFNSKSTLCRTFLCMSMTFLIDILDFGESISLSDSLSISRILLIVSPRCFTKGKQRIAVVLTSAGFTQQFQRFSGAPPLKKQCPKAFLLSGISVPA